MREWTSQTLILEISGMALSSRDPTTLMEPPEREGRLAKVEIRDQNFAE